MPAVPKTKSTHFSRKTLLIAGAVITVAVIGYLYWRKKKQENTATAAYSQDLGGPPGQNYLPATGLGGASQLGQGVAAPPPPNPVICPGGQAPNADGTCPGPPTPTPPPPPSGGSYKHSCVKGAGPGCGWMGDGWHCEFQWVAGDNSGSPTPPPKCIPAGGTSQQNPQNQSSTVAPGTAGITPTADVLSGIGTSAPNALPPAVPSLVQPTATSDASVRLLHVTQYVGRGGNPSNPYEAQTAIEPMPPPTFPTPTFPPVSSGADHRIGPPNRPPTPTPPVTEPGGGTATGR